MRLDSRNGKDITGQFPEIVEALTETLPARLSVALDGELVAAGPGGTPDFAVLQRRLAARSTPRLRALVPVQYVVFDVTWLGESTIDLPYLRRRAMLTELGFAHPGLLVPEHYLGLDPAVLLDLAERYGLEGLIGKAVDSRYRPGIRSSARLKVVIRRKLEVWIGGWIPSRSGLGEAWARCSSAGPARHPRTPCESAWSSTAPSEPAGKPPKAAGCWRG